MEMEWQGVTMAAVRGSRRVALAADARSGSAVSGLKSMNSQVTTNIGCHDGKLLGEEKEMAGGQCDRDEYSRLTRLRGKTRKWWLSHTK